MTLRPPSFRENYGNPEPARAVGGLCDRVPTIAHRPEEINVADTERPEVRLVAHCRRCRGWLLSAKSIAEGIGPTCAMRERAEQRAAATELTLFDFAA